MKILSLDLETMFSTVGTFGLFNQNIGINQILEDGHVICYAYKWLDEKDITFKRKEDQDFLTNIHEALTESDAILTYNGKRFDLPHLNREFVKAGLRPPAPYKHIDLLDTVKKQFRFPSNKLQHVAKELGIGSKVSHEGFELWVKCLEGNEAAWRTMEKYNIQDVKLLEKLYHRIKPWIKDHPNSMSGCPQCGSSHLQSRGVVRSKSSTYKRFYCVDCGTWSREKKVDDTADMVGL